VRAALLRAELVPGDIACVFGTAAGRIAIEAELAAVASSLEMPPGKAKELTTSAGAVLGEVMSAGAPLALAAVCAGGTVGPTLVVSAEQTGTRLSAVAVIVGPA
jgi:hypothetical protein